MPAQLRPQSALRLPGRYVEVEEAPDIRPIFVHPPVEFNPELGKSCAFPSLPLDHVGRTPNQAFADLSRVMRRVLEPRMVPKPPSSRQQSQDGSGEDELEERQYVLVGPSKEKREAIVIHYLDTTTERLGDDMATYEAIEIEAAAQEAIEAGEFSPSRRASVVSFPNKGPVAPVDPASVNGPEYLSTMDWGSDEGDDQDDDASPNQDPKSRLYPATRYTWKDVPDNVKMVILKELTAHVPLEQAVTEVLDITADEFIDFLALYRSEQDRLAEWTARIDEDLEQRDMLMMADPHRYFDEWDQIQEASYSRVGTKPVLITDFISSDEIKIGQAYLRSNGLGVLAEGLAAWMGHSERSEFKIDMASKYIEVGEDPAALFAALGGGRGGGVGQSRPSALPFATVYPQRPSINPRDLFINPPDFLSEPDDEEEEEPEAYETDDGEDQSDAVMAEAEDDDEPIPARGGGKEKPPASSPARAPVVAAQPVSPTTAMDVDVPDQPAQLALATGVDANEAQDQPVQPAPAMDLDIEKVPHRPQPAADMDSEAAGHADQPAGDEQPATIDNLSPSKSNRPARRIPAAKAKAAIVFDDPDDEDYQPTKRASAKRKRQPSVSSSNQGSGGRKQTVSPQKQGGSQGRKGGSNGSKGGGSGGRKRGGSGGSKAGGSGGRKGGGSGGQKRPPAKKTKVSGDVSDQPVTPAVPTMTQPAPTALPAMTQPPVAAAAAVSAPPPKTPGRGRPSRAARGETKQTTAVKGMISDKAPSTGLQTEQTVAHAKHVLNGSAKLVEETLDNPPNQLIWWEARRLNLTGQDLSWAGIEPPAKRIDRLADIARRKAQSEAFTETLTKAKITVGPIQSTPQSTAAPASTPSLALGSDGNAVAKTDEQPAQSAPVVVSQADKQLSPVPALNTDKNAVSQSDKPATLAPAPETQSVPPEKTLWEAKLHDRLSGLEPVKPFIVKARMEFSKSAPLTVDGRSVFLAGYLDFEPGQVMLVTRVAGYASSPHLDMYFGRYQRANGSPATGCFPKDRVENIDNSLEQPALFYVVLKPIPEEALAEEDRPPFKVGELIAVTAVEGGASSPAVYYGQTISKDGPGPSAWISATLVDRCWDQPDNEQPPGDEQPLPDDEEEVSLIEVPAEQFHARE